MIGADNYSIFAGIVLPGIWLSAFNRNLNILNYLVCVQQHLFLQ